MADIAAVTAGIRNADVRKPNAAHAGNPATLPTGQCASIRNVNHLIGQVAAFDCNVLILGESGTGKEVVARAIHEISARRLRPFVPINCGAIPSELMESELFGHEKGAFTGALATRKGRFEMADGGIIFLDEIGDMNPAMQVKLLRVLQERMFERVGSCISQRCDVRVIAATHRNLEEAIAKGAFREDLFYRLSVVPIELPPLRERGADLQLLIAELADRMSAAGRPRVRFTDAALQALQAYRWPGNVRELGNLIERMSIQCGARLVTIADLPPRYRLPDGRAEGELRPEAIIASTPPEAVAGPAPPALSTGAAAEAAPLPEGEPLALLTPAATELDAGPEGLEPAAMDAALTDLLLQQIPSGFDLRSYLEALEQRLIAQAMEAAGGTVAQAARLLGLRRTTLVEKLRKYPSAGSAAQTPES